LAPRYDSEPSLRAKRSNPERFRSTGLLRRFAPRNDEGGRIETGFRIIAAALGWFAIITQYLLMAANAGPHLVERSINFFSYFTIVSNILVALALTLPWLAPGSRAGRFFMLPSVRTAIAAYIIIVAVVYHTMLSRLYHPQGWRLVCDIILHYVMPPLFVLDWALFVDKRGLSWKLSLHSFALPAVYLVWTALHGAFAGFYPYPFLNVNRIGYEQSLMNVGGLIVAFVCLILALVGIGRVLSRGPHPEEHVR
jgi:hypothetical protein